MHLVTQFLLYYADKFFELTVAEAEIDFEIELGRGVIPPSFLFSIPRNLLALADIIFAASITCLQSVADPNRYCHQAPMLLVRVLRLLYFYKQHLGSYKYSAIDRVIASLRCP